MAGRRIVSIIVLVVAAFSGVSATLPPIDPARAVDFQTVLSSLEQINLIDIRTRQELLDVGYIPGAQHLPIKELEKALDLTDEAFQAKYGFPKLKPDDETLVIYCGSGGRARVADGILQKKGFTKHKIYYGSFDDWRANKGPIATVI